MTFSTRYIADYFFACSKEAGIDRYGEKIVNSNHFKVVMNGIESSKYSYNPEKRKSIRDKYKISSDTIVFGHVGRFEKVKNHDKIITVFNEFHKEHSKSILWLFGTGTEENRIKAMVKQMHLSDSVFFMGVSDHIWDYLQAMDLFLFPSYYEGLGIALIEAQASGLPCVVSDAIQSEADIKAGLIKRENLDSDIDKWIEAIDRMLELPRRDTEAFVKKAGFDIEEVAAQMQKFYFKVNAKYEK